MPEDGLAWRPWHGWLPAVLPAGARTFRASDPAMADTLRASGAAPAAAAAGRAVRRADARVGLSGVLLVVAEDHVLRVVLAAGAAQIADGVGFLGALRATGPGAAVAERIAWPQAEGELPLARWVLEPRL